MESAPGEETLQVVEALLMATPEPLTRARFNQCLERPEVSLEAVIETLRLRFEEQKRPVQIVFVDGGYQLVTKAEYQPYLQRLFQKPGRLSLTRAALETIAVVAYRQPVTKLEIDQIRGVNSDSTIKTLLERELINIAGREEAMGRPLLYGTTGQFLQAFGLGNLSDMPKLREIREIMGETESPTPVVHETE